MCERNKPAQQNRAINVCNHCQKKGHTEAERFEKLFCKICKIKGHWANRFCSAKVQNARAVPFEGNFSPNGQQNSPRNFQNNRRNPSSSSPSGENRAQTSLAQLKCYNCDQQGHIARQCPLKIRKIRETSAGPVKADRLDSRQYRKGESANSQY